MSWPEEHADRYVAASRDLTAEVEFYVGPGLDDGATRSLWRATRNERIGLTGGLELEALFGDFDRCPFNGHSTECVFVTRCPETPREQTVG